MYAIFYTKSFYYHFVRNLRRYFSILSLFPFQDEPLQATTAKWNYLQEHVACFKNTVHHLDSDFP